MAAEKVGYARVSTREQNIGSQIDALNKFGCSRVYSEKKSGKNNERQELKKCLEYLRKGDTLVVTTLERLGRDLIDVVLLVRSLYDRGIKVECLSHPIDWESAHGKLIVSITLAVAQYERELMLEKQARGLEFSREKGIIGGRKKGETKIDPAPVVEMYRKKRSLGKNHREACEEVAKHFPVGHATVGRYAENAGAYKRKRGAKNTV